MKRYLLLILIILEYPFVLIARKIEPTDMAGPGFDIPALILVFFFDIYVVWKTIEHWREGILPKLYLIAFVISAYLLYHWVTAPQK